MAKVDAQGALHDDATGRYANKPNTPPSGDLPLGKSQLLLEPDLKESLELVVGEPQIEREMLFLGVEAEETVSIIDHPGTATVVELNRYLHPDLTEIQREDLLERLHEEAVQAGLDETPVVGEHIEAWLNATYFQVDDLEMSAVERARALESVENLRDLYEENPTSITEADMHAWKYLHKASDAEIVRQTRSDAKRIAVDLDGVLYDCHTTMVPWLKSRGYSHKDTPMDRYDMAGHWSTTPQVIFEEFQAAARAGLIFRHGDPLPDGIAAVQRLHKSGHKIVIVTARDLPGIEQDCRQATVRWLRDQGVPFDEVHLTSTKEDVDFDVLLDDAPSNVARVNGFSKKGIIIDRPWNRNEGDGHHRRSFVDFVRELSAPPSEDVLFETSPTLSSASKDATIPLGASSNAGPAKTA